MYCVGQCPDGPDGLPVVPGEKGQGACPGGIRELYMTEGYLYVMCFMLFFCLLTVALFMKAGIIPLPWQKVWVSAHQKTEQAGQKVAADSSRASSGGSAPGRAASRRETLNSALKGGGAAASSRSLGR
jgi:hypothetical protein